MPSACRALALATLVAIAACSAEPRRAAAPKPPGNRCGGEAAFAAGAERATLWIRTSVEFRAASETLFRAAEAALARGLADPAWSAEPEQMVADSTLPPAVVMDIDETVLDNSAPQARMLLERTCLEEFPAVWDRWLAERSAPAVPGALAFIHAAREMKDAQGRAVRVFFITNRECSRREGNSSPCPQQDDTLANLWSLGLDAPTLADDLMVKGERPGWASEKLSRRKEVARTHRIVLNIGDDFGDFLPAVRLQSVAERERARCAHRERWGRQWFMIPNPMYGSWLVALGRDPQSALAAQHPVAGNCDTD